MIIARMLNSAMILRQLNDVHPWHIRVSRTESFKCSMTRMFWTYRTKSINNGIIIALVRSILTESRKNVGR